VDSWQRHVRKRNITVLVGVCIYWGYTIALCVLTEQFILSDPARLLPNNEEQQWTFGQILAVVSLLAIAANISEHLGKMPWYPVPDFEPSNSRFTLYMHLLLDCIDQPRN
jgi:hypothetical protein